MKASELISRLQEAIEKSGDKEVVLAANKHSYKDAKRVVRENEITLALFDKIAD